ncbi:hypothetical protein BDV24DRAFT_163077 [Aspergillus arachidicola]|uniref:Hemopexin n=1 Tax=Aspergillus arachidicola TaxID=656916 RepID=A0A5N6YAI1_9EURO|nr:hypothetical protein BDV24DRAFT_163077 [Aspergillus arachidicola]
MVDAAFFHSDIGEGFFFGGRNCARIWWNPVGQGEEKRWGPTKIVEKWPSFEKMRLGRVDAVLPVEGVATDAYFFFGSLVARISIQSDETVQVIEEPVKITDKWSALAEGGFDRIDTAVPIPRVPNTAYLFRGTQYIQLNVQSGEATRPRAFDQYWPGLKGAHFDSVDAALPLPGYIDRIYFFKGSMYIIAKVNTGQPDVITYGPASISTHWKTLDWA